MSWYGNLIETEAGAFLGLWGPLPIAARPHGERLQTKTNLYRMLVSVPLTDDERTAVQDGQATMAPVATLLAIVVVVGLEPRTGGS